MSILPNCEQYYTPEVNMKPENLPLEKEIRFGNHHFQGF